VDLRSGDTKHASSSSSSSSISSSSSSMLSSLGHAISAPFKPSKKVFIGDWWDFHPAPEWFQRRAHFQPLRLSLKERTYMRLAQEALDVTEYTSVLDQARYVVNENTGNAENSRKLMKARAQRTFQQIKNICGVISGLAVGTEYKKGQQILQENSFAENSDFFQNMLELVRRHKIRNPEKMVGAYEKLCYILQDSAQVCVCVCRICAHV
jgi:hypothetical protein